MLEQFLLSSVAFADARLPASETNSRPQSASQFGDNRSCPEDGQGGTVRERQNSVRDSKPLAELHHLRRAASAVLLIVLDFRTLEPREHWIDTSRGLPVTMGGYVALLSTAFPRLTTSP